MLNYMWAIMLIIGILYGGISGNIGAVGESLLSSAGDAVTLCITMVGVMTVWCGLMEVAKSSGLIEEITKAIHPLICLLFPRIPEDHPAREYITTNIVANILGLGWAATPAGLQAMTSLKDLEEERRKEGKSHFSSETASDEMCTFLIINISSLQLIPVNMIAYRSQYGSANPTAVVGPALIATFISTIVAVVFCKMMSDISRVKNTRIYKYKNTSSKGLP